MVTLNKVVSKGDVNITVRETFKQNVEFLDTDTELLNVTLLVENLKVNIWIF